MKKTNPFKSVIKSKARFAQMFANEVSGFAENNYRKKVFSIKSTLSGDVYTDELLYMAINVPRKITRTFTNYVVGKGIKVDFGKKDINEKFVKMWDEQGRQQKLNTAIDSQSSIGYGVVRVRNRGEHDVRIEHIPVTNYCADMSGLSIGDDFADIRTHYVFSVITIDSKHYFHCDRYTKEGGKRRGYYGERYTFNDKFLFDELVQSAETEEELDFLPLFLFNNDLSNPHTAIDPTKPTNEGNLSRYFHQSDYVDIADVVQELNDRSSQISVEFIKHLTSKMSLPQSFRENKSALALKRKADTQHRFDTKTVPDYFSHTVGEQPAQYITKDTQHLNTSIQNYIPLLMRYVSALSCVPQAMLGMEAMAGNNPVGTTEKEFEAFYARVQAKQQLIYSPLQNLFKAVMVFAGYANAPLPTIKFAKVETRDVGTKTDIASTQIALGIMSKKSAMQYTMGYDEKEIQEEIDQISAEEKEAYARSGGTIDN